MNKAKLIIDGQEYQLDTLQGTEQERALDTTRLRSQSGLITLDSGYANTGSCQSAITFLNGEKGILKYRGIPIEQLAEKGHFIEVAYLLIHGNLPTEKQLSNFGQRIGQQSGISDETRKMLQQFPIRQMHPMGALSAATVALSAFYPQWNQPDLSAEESELAMIQLIGQMKTIIATCYRISKGKDLLAPNLALDFCCDFLQMMFGGESERVEPEVAKALDVLLILHADHEQNCSTSTVRMVGSGKANIFAAIAAGINALWGPLHGGANEAVIDMLDAIQADGGNYNKFLAKAKDKKDPFRLMGFGHRVYKNFDPRAKIIKRACDTVLTKLGVQDPVFDIARGLEESALQDDYFIQRKLYPNVDFYSGIIYRALGIPTNFFTPMFVLGRLPGWLAQWKELREDPKMRICRPRQIYVGKIDQEYMAIQKRS